MTPQIAAATPGTTLPPTAGTSAGTGAGTGATEGGFWSHPLKSTNAFLRENEPILKVLQSGTQGQGRRSGGGGMQLSGPPQLPAVTAPPQLDRLAFLRAFGVQG